MKIASIFIFFVAILGYNNNNNTAMTNEQLDSLCRTLSDECRATISSKAKDNDEDLNIRFLGNWFPTYLEKAYNTTNAPKIHINEKQLNEGKLLRIAEGSFRIEERVSPYGEVKYLLPVEMSETEYFFLNGELIKISITKGLTDYNALPQNFWIRIEQLDLIYEKDKPVKKAVYSYFGQWNSLSKVSDEWIENFIRHYKINEDTLIERSRILLSENGL